MKFLYGIFAITIFVSSFLLFQVQPLIGKHILPWYGGSSAVWVTAMLFFMVALAVGYIYALLLSRFKLLYQAIIHVLVLTTTLIVVKSNFQIWPSAITPTIDDLTIGFSDPVLAVFFTLLLTVGLPFTLLSSTSSLLQLWYGTLSGKEPFSLYGISNIGSLLGLLSYPIFFERWFSTYVQGQLWTYTFVVYVALMLVILYTVFIFNKKSETKKELMVGQKFQASSKQFLIWAGVASVPVMVMLTGTSFMTVSVAPVPFLWVGPLALYLLSFIITFRSGFRLPLWINEVIVVLSSITLLLVAVSSFNIFLVVLLTHLTLFAIYHWCHEVLYESRPVTEGLTLFYVALSIGGIFGSLLIKILSAYLLVIPIELILILLFSALFISYRWYLNKDTAIPIFNFKLTKAISLFFMIVVVVASAFHIYKFEHDSVAKKRNFYGYKAVVMSDLNDVKTLSLQHGITNHGYQIYQDGELLNVPTSYYGSSSGVGEVFSFLQSRDEFGLSVAIAGLGSGGLLPYCRDKDNFIYFEIDQNVIDLAKDHFTYLEYCANNEIILADARLALQKIKNEKGGGLYDFIILDAYADDMMPMHLMTKEAVDLYQSLLKPDGVLAIHISSRYLNLLPVIKAVAEANMLSAKFLHDNNPDVNAVESLWTVMVKDQDIFSNEIFVNNFSDFSEVEKSVLWTDTYSALWPVVKF